MIESHSDQVLGARIQMRRREGGFCESEFASRIGVPLQTLRAYERGARHVGASALTRISQALQIPPLALFATEEMAAGEDEADAEWSGTSDTERERMRLLRAFSGIANREVRLCVVSLLEQISEANDLAEELLEQAVRSR